MEHFQAAFSAVLITFITLLRFSEANDCSRSYPVLVSISGESGTLSIPRMAMNSWGNKYRNERLCQWQITTPANTIVQLRLDTFELENGILGACIYDRVTIMDPDSGVRTVRCGELTEPEVIRSTTNSLYIIFSSDSSITAAGFTASYWSTEIETTTTTSPPPTTTAESTTTSNSETTTNSNSETTTTSNSETTTAEMETTSVILTSLMTTTTITTTRSPPEASICSGTPWSDRMTHDFGRVETEGFQYINNQRCTWIIEAPVGMRVLMEFESFDVEFKSDCRYDYLSVFNSDGTEGKKLASLCGTSLPLRLTSTDRHLTLHFSSDSSVTGSGFTATYRFIQPGEVACSGPVELSGPSGELSIGVDLMYMNNADCLWIITAAEGETVSVDFEDISIEPHSSCLYDNLSIYDGPDTSSSPLLATKCGTIDTYSVTSTDRSVSIHFTTDISITSTGFKATYRTVPSSGSSSESETTTTTSATTVDPTVPTCGVRSDSSRIVGGNESVANSWPWQVSLQYTNDFHFCGGSLIASRWVVTAAHCTRGKALGSFKVVVKAHDLSTNDGQDVDVDAMFTHEEYVNGIYINDIALLRLANDVTGSGVFPICLPSMDAVPSARCYVTGWGTLSSGGPSPDTLQEALVTIFTNAQCSSFGYGSAIKDSMVCAGSGPNAENPTDTCQGDSGGPLACPQADGTYTLTGITSWGYGCASSYGGGVYTRVFSFVDWIETTRNNNS